MSPRAPLPSLLIHPPSSMIYLSILIALRTDGTYQTLAQSLSSTPGTDASGAVSALHRELMESPDSGQRLQHFSALLLIQDNQSRALNTFELPEGYDPSTLPPLADTASELEPLRAQIGVLSAELAQLKATATKKAKS